jgi:hypothetical protein
VPAYGLRSLSSDEKDAARGVPVKRPEKWGDLRALPTVKKA